MNDRQAELIEAVQLLHSLKKPIELICNQLDLHPDEVAAIVATGTISKRQKSLFAEPKASKPQSRWEPVIEACKIHPAGKPTNQNQLNGNSTDDIDDGQQAFRRGKPQTAGGRAMGSDSAIRLPSD